MSVLLDTHVLLWFQSLDKRLPAKLRERVEQSDDDYFVSQVSLRGGPKNRIERGASFGLIEFRFIGRAFQPVFRAFSIHEVTRSPWLVVWREG